MRIERVLDPYAICEFAVEDDGCLVVASTSCVVQIAVATMSGRWWKMPAGPSRPRKMTQNETSDFQKFKDSSYKNRRTNP
jgi:hypothetical protein